MGICGCGEGTDFLISSRKVCSFKLIQPCQNCNEKTVVLSIIKIEKGDVRFERECGTLELFKGGHDIDGLQILDFEKFKKLFLANYKHWLIDGDTFDDIHAEIIFDDFLADILSTAIQETWSEVLDAKEGNR